MLVAFTIVATPALAKPVHIVPPTLTTLAQEKLGKDFRITFTLKKHYNICGGEKGDTYVGQVEMNRYQRGYTAEGKLELTDHWIKLDKHYAIAANEVFNPNAALFDSDRCME